ncbi:unnamed protein product [Rotaria sordida]|uniref:Glycoside hydrolase 35 catalytic domain-containing protein n=1 Tax=Rotaria sordida TaxID=392033 RepID=A0A814HNZ2_9BILA|nr:unnamed protein product [Rotaria sordida]CAF1273807.1 unnamed protein product [Rotaria sordida]
MRKFLMKIIEYINPYLAKNGGPIILAQIENEFSSTEIPWILCNGHAANSTIETCNSCNCLDDGQAVAIRTTTDFAYSVAEWFAGDGSYHSSYMWHGGNNYGRTAASGITTMYSDDALLHADGIPNEPKYTQLSRLQHLITNYAQDGQKWSIGTEQFVYSYPPSLHFICNQNNNTFGVLFRNKNISITGHSVRIFDNNLNLLLDSTNVSDIRSDNTEIFPIIIEQLKITNDETIYLWYRRNVTLTQTQSHTLVRVETRKANALLFFLNGKYLGEFDNHDHSQGSLTATISLDLSTFKSNQQYLFEILSISLGINNDIWENNFDYKGIVGNIWLNDQLLINDQTNLWEHQKGLVGEYFQIYTEQGSSKVEWNTQWTKGINKPITWFQARFNLDHIIREDLNTNPILLDAQRLNRGHAFISGNDLGLYWLLQGVCHDSTPCCCPQAQINCLQPTQRAPSPNSVGIAQRVVIA